MPIINSTPGAASPTGGIGAFREAPAADDPTIGKVLRAAFIRENTIASVIASPEGGNAFEIDNTFDAFDNIEGFEEHAGAFAFANTPEDVERIKQGIANERENMKILEAGGTTAFFATFAAGTLDPVILFPPVKAAATGAKVVSTLRAGLRTGRAGMLGSAAAEVLLHGSQETRTGLESGVNIAGATFLSALLGGSVNALVSRAGRSVPVNSVVDDLGVQIERDLDPVPDVPDIRDEGSVVISEADTRVDIPNLDEKRIASQSREDRPGDAGGDAGTVARAEGEDASGAPRAGDGGAVQAAAREDNPVLFTKIDGLQTQRNSLRGEFTRAIRERNEADSVPRIDDEFVELRARQETATRRNAKKLQTRIDDLEGEKAAEVAAARQVETPEITTLRKRLQDTELKLRDLALETSDAVRRARAKVVGEVEPAPAAPAERQVQEVETQINEALDALDVRPVDGEQLVNAARAVLRDEVDIEDVVEEVLARQAADDSGVSVRLVDEDEGAAAAIDEGAAVIPEQAPSSREDLADAQEILETELGDDILGGPPQEAGGSVGAASALPTRSEETVKSALGMERLTAFAAPGLRMLTSPFLASRRAVQSLARSALTHEKNALGIATPVAVETLVDAHQFKLGQTIGALDNLYVKYRTGNAAGGRAGRLKLQVGDRVSGGRSGDTLSFREFKEAVSGALRRGDEHDIPEVAEAAKMARREVLDNLKDKAIEAKLLDEDVGVDETATSYLMRMYNNEKIVARSDEFLQIVTRWLIHRRDTVDIPNLEKAEREIAERASHVLERDIVETDLIGKRGAIRKHVIDRGTIDDLELASVAEEIMGRILSTPAGRLPYDAHIGKPSRQSFAANQSARGPLARRAFLIPDEMIEEFLENDVDVLLRAYTRTMAPDTEIALRFDDVDMVPQMKAIQDEAFEAIRLVEGEEGLTPRQRERRRTRINKRKDADIRDLTAMMNRLKGIDGRPDNPHGIGVRALRVAREVNLLSKLGGMTISALPDVFRPVMVEGVTRVLRHAVAPMITNLKGLRMAKAEARELGAIVEMVLDTRVASISDLGDDFGRHTAFERGLGAMTDSFGLVSGMAPWNQFWKEVSGTVTMSRILTEANNWRAGTIKAGDVERLAAGGIDKPMAIRIANMMDAHGLNDRGVMQSNYGNWSDRGAADAMRGAIIREVEGTIVTPGIGDRPLLMSSTQAGRNIGQFKSFMFAAHQSVFLAGLQRRDAATLNGLALSVAGGMLVYYLKQLGSERPISDDPRVWVAEGIDRSGVTGFLFDINNMAEKIGVNVLPGGPTRSRYASRNLVGALLGPSAGLATDVGQIVGNTVSGDIRASDTRALRRAIPYQNLFYIRNLLNRAEEGVNDTFDLPKTKRKRQNKRRLNR